MKALAMGLVALVIAGGVAVAGGTIAPGSKGDSWSQAVGKDEHGNPLIHSLRIREVVLYGTSDKAARARFEALKKQLVGGR